MLIHARILNCTYLVFYFAFNYRFKEFIKDQLVNIPTAPPATRVAPSLLPPAAVHASSVITDPADVLAGLI